MANLKKPTSGKILKTKHFPTDFQAVIFRLWEMVPAKKIAEILNTTEENIIIAAQNMGLEKQIYLDNWMDRGYISILRAIWNLLPYEQICKLLDWDEEHLSYILKEDDYLGEKLGEKCDCPYVTFRELSDSEQKETRKIKDSMNKLITELRNEKFEPPFDFFKRRYSPITDNTTFSIVVDSDWSIEYDPNEIISDFIEDFKTFASTYNITFSKKSNKKIQIILNSDFGDNEDHKIEISPCKITITAAKPMGILRALYYIEELVESTGNFSFEEKTYNRKTKIKTRFIYSFCGLYGNVLDCDTKISFPDDLLKEYAKKGINGVWIQGVLYKLSPYPFDNTMSYGWQTRINNLNELTKRAARFGIKIYVYLNEPRSMPPSFFENHPELKGATLRDDSSCLCSSLPEVHEYLRQSLKSLCENVPLLGGFIVITQTENNVLCWSQGKNTPPGGECPVCSKKQPSTVISDILNTMSGAVKKANPDMKFFFFAWSLSHTIGEKEAEILLKKLPKDIIILQVSETEMPFEIGGVKDEILDYSLSIIGPGECAKKQWKIARETGLETAAKIQINNSWEASTAPFIPVYDNIVTHMKNLISEGVEHLMLSWTLGGYISDNIKIASSFFFEDDHDEYDGILTKTYGKYKDKVKDAVKYFCKGFSEFPFNWKHIYNGPANSGVANLLYPEPSGMKSTMTCFPYDDLYTWRGIAAENPTRSDLPLYPVNVLENQYRLICKDWEKGLEIIADMPDCEFKDMAIYTYTLFKASHNQIMYYIERDGKRDVQKMENIIKSEKKLALEALKIMLRNSSVGYEAANHYYVTRSALAEKIIQCDYLLN